MTGWLFMVVDLIILDSHHLAMFFLILREMDWWILIEWMKSHKTSFARSLLASISRCLKRTLYNPFFFGSIPRCCRCFFFAQDPQWPSQLGIPSESSLKSAAGVVPGLKSPHENHASPVKPQRCTKENHKMGGSINGGSPIAGWFISWESLLELGG